VPIGTKSAAAGAYQVPVSLRAKKFARRNDASRDEQRKPQAHDPAADHQPQPLRLVQATRRCASYQNFTGTSAPRIELSLAF